LFRRLIRLQEKSNPFQQAAIHNIPSSPAGGSVEMQAIQMPAVNSKKNIRFILSKIINISLIINAGTLIFAAYRKLPQLIGLPGSQE
jgi:hypothetical protein